MLFRLHGVLSSKHSIMTTVNACRVLITIKKRRKKMERKRLRKLVGPILLVAVLVIILPSEAVFGQSEELTPDEIILLSHLPD